MLSVVKVLSIECSSNSLSRARPRATRDSQALLQAVRSLCWFRLRWCKALGQWVSDFMHSFGILSRVPIISMYYTSNFIWSQKPKCYFIVWLFDYAPARSTPSSVVHIMHRCVILLKLDSYVNIIRLFRPLYCDVVLADHGCTVLIIPCRLICSYVCIRIRISKYNTVV